MGKKPTEFHNRISCEAGAISKALTWRTMWAVYFTSAKFICRFLTTDTFKYFLIIFFKNSTSVLEVPSSVYYSRIYNRWLVHLKRTGLKQTLATFQGENHYDLLWLNISRTTAQQRYFPFTLVEIFLPASTCNSFSQVIPVIILLYRFIRMTVFRKKSTAVFFRSQKLEYNIWLQK